MFQKVNKYLTYIPVLLVWEYLFLFLLKDSVWYKLNAKLIDDIDNFIVFFVIIHFLSFIELYNKKQLNYCLSIFLIILLQFWYYFIHENVYYFIYLLLILFPIIISVTQWLTISKTKDSTE